MTRDTLLLTATILFVLLLAGCESHQERQIRYYKEHGIEYTIGKGEDSWEVKHIRWCQQNGGASEAQLEFLRDHTVLSQ